MRKDQKKKLKNAALIGAGVVVGIGLISVYRKGYDKGMAKGIAVVAQGVQAGGENRENTLEVLETIKFDQPITFVQNDDILGLKPAKVIADVD